MIEAIDTGFGDVEAGEIYNPDVVVTATVTSPQPDIPSEKTGPDLTEDLGSEEPPICEQTTRGLTAAGRQAAKALVQLPPMTWPDLARLAREMAMDIKEEHVVLKEFKLDNAQFEYLKEHNDFFREAFAAACKEWHGPLSTPDRIKVEAAAILEDSLPGLGARMQNKGEGLPGVVETAKLFAKIAGVGERESGSAAAGERFSINIDLGGDTRVTVSSAGPQAAPAQSNLVIAIPDNAGSG